MFRTLRLIGASVIVLAATSTEALTLAYTGAIQHYAVTQTGNYSLVAAGGSGGSVFGRYIYGDVFYAGGHGITIGAQVTLTAGTMLDIVVGGGGGGGRYGGGGGGGTFILLAPGTPVVVAGGGGGRGIYDVSYFDSVGVAGSSGHDGGGITILGGVIGGRRHADFFNGGRGGTGGSNGTTGVLPFTGFAGGGLYGGSYLLTDVFCGRGQGDVCGGFGGGGGANNVAGGTGGGGEGGGGGGGFSGGGGGWSGHSGGGGGSFIQTDATEISTTANLGINGFASINLIASDGVPEPTTWIMLTLGFGAIGAMMRRRKTQLG